MRTACGKTTTCAKHIWAGSREGVIANMHWGRRRSAASPEGSVPVSSPSSAPFRRRHGGILFALPSRIAHSFIVFTVAILGALSLALFTLDGTAWAETESEVASSSAEEFETPEYKAQEGLAVVNAAQAYALGYTGRGVVIAVVDTGVDGRHREFLGNVTDGYDFIKGQGTKPGESVDTAGHGSHVAGIIAARRDGHGIHGLAFGATLLPLRLDMDGDMYDDFERNIAPAWAYLAEQDVPGVLVVNNSLGVGERHRPSVNRQYIEENWPNTAANLRKLAASGALLVFATGNDGSWEPDVLANLPYYYVLDDAELEDRWLAVTAVDINGEPTSYANWCGQARWWCLAAPGGDTDGAGGVYSVEAGGEYVRMDGTSMAAPHVSAAAALVLEAFPFFDAYQVQQTLLTTATDIGDAGVDHQFGWGLLNVAKALQGPAQLTVSPNIFRSPQPFFDVDTKGYSATFSNDISGAGKLGKKGEGVLTLTGTNTYSGGTEVNGGVLVTANRSALGTGELNIGSQGTVQLATDLAGVSSVENEGTIVLGTYQLAAESYRGDGGTLVVATGGNRSRPALSVEGTANIEQTHLRLDLDALPAVGQRLVLVSASGGIQGSFVDGDRPRRLGAIQFGAVENGGGEAAITVVSKQFIDEATAYSPNQRALLAMLEAPDTAGGTKLLAALAQLDPGSAAQTTAANHVSGDALTAYPLAADAAARHFVRHVPLPADTEAESGDNSLLSPDRQGAKFVPEHISRFTAWASGFASRAHTRSDGNGPGSHNDYTGWLGGGHWRFPKGNLSLAMGEARTQVNVSDRASARGRVTSNGVVLSGAYADRGWFVRGTAGYIRHQVTGQRRMDVAGTESSATADYDATTHLLEGAVGRRLHRGSVMMEPSIGWRTSRTRQSGFREYGEDGLTVEGSTYRSPRAVLGLRLVSATSHRGTAIQSEMRLGYEREMGDSRAELTVRRNDGTGAPYRVTSPALGRDIVTLGIGATVALKERLTLRADLDAEWRERHTTHTAHLALRYQW